MGKITGFIEYERKTASYRPVPERLRDYSDVVRYLPEEEIRTQAARCMDCGIPFCHSKGCPLFNLIPEWNHLVYKGEWEEALSRLEATNNFPEITGRICPAPCECACTLAINSSPVTIRQVELAVVEHGFKNGLVKPKPPRFETGKKIAVIGSGPAGLAASQQLRRLGHSVRVYERAKKTGGILRYGIPDFKLEKYIIDRRIEQMKAEGVCFETDVNIGEDISARYLEKNYDAVLLTVGAREPRDLKIPGRELSGIYQALEYLMQSNRNVSGESTKGHVLPHSDSSGACSQTAPCLSINAADKSVLVIGGGDTGSDCVGTANRQGAKRIYQFEIMPKPLEWKQPFNPVWPEWPLILRTSSSHEEGCSRDWNITTKKFEGDGAVKKATFCRVEWKSPGPGKPSQPVEIPGSEFTLEVDLVFLAMGFVHLEHGRLITELNVALDGRGFIAKKTGSYATSAPKIYVAGDADTGASLVVRAIYHGREAAKEINNFLMNIIP